MSERSEVTNEGPPERSELMQLYLATLEDYQFQVNLTWSRTQYCLTLNAALVSVAAGLIKLADEGVNVLVAGVFAVGVLASVFSVVALDTGRSYYLPVITRMKTLEAALSIEKYGIRTTPEQGGSGRRISITKSLKGLFVGLAVIDAAGFFYTLFIR